MEHQTRQSAPSNDDMIKRLEQLQQENAELREKLRKQLGLPAAVTVTETLEVTENTGSEVTSTNPDNFTPDPWSSETEEEATDEAEPEDIPCGLTGIINSNRDHSSSTSWGKNQFNNSFPIGLISYMESKGIKPVYLKVDSDFKVQHDYIGFEELTGCAYDPSNIYYEFESSFSPYSTTSSSKHMPSIDVIVKKKALIEQPTRALEIKLTTLPDSTTSELTEDKYGSELVVRPDTIVYQALSICRSLAKHREELSEILNPVYEEFKNWEDVKVVAKNFGKIIAALSAIVKQFSDKQSPLLLQPVWKTEGKAAILDENCLDAFVWSDFSLMKLFIKNVDTERLIISRNDRTIIWLFLMLRQFAATGKVDHTEIIDRFTYGTKNDKAFAVSGKFTNSIMSCP